MRRCQISVSSISANNAHRVNTQYFKMYNIDIVLYIFANILKQ